MQVYHEAIVNIVYEIIVDSLSLSIQIHAWLRNVEVAGSVL